MSDLFGNHIVGGSYKSTYLWRCVLMIRRRNRLGQERRTCIIRRLGVELSTCHTPYLKRIIEIIKKISYKRNKSYDFFVCVFVLWFTGKTPVNSHFKPFWDGATISWVLTRTMKS